jgi:hypothetical protein
MKHKLYINMTMFKLYVRYNCKPQRNLLPKHLTPEVIMTNKKLVHYLLPI